MSKKEKEIKRLRMLAKRVLGIASLPIQKQRISLWKEHNNLSSSLPLVLIFPEGAFSELIPEHVLICENPIFKEVERTLLERIYYHEHLQDDNPIIQDLIVQKKILPFDFGLEEKRIYSEEKRGSYHVKPVLETPSDADRLTLPKVIYDKETTLAEYNLISEAVGDILPVSIKGKQFLSFHFSSQYIAWRGLEQMLMDLYLEPELVHRVMQFLTKAYTHILDEYERQDLIDYNCDGTYHSSGGNGYIEGICDQNLTPKINRMWGSAESQEMASVGPAQHKEFLMHYEAQILKRFALTGYGCCDDLTKKLDDIISLVPNLRRISISPWAEVDACAEILGNNVIYSWKPQPAQLVGTFDEDYIRKYIRKTLESTLKHENILEIILKDTHTVEHHPERFKKWMRIVREEIGYVYGSEIGL